MPLDKEDPLFVDLGWLFAITRHLTVTPSTFTFSDWLGLSGGSDALHATLAVPFYSLNVAVRGDIFVLLSQFFISA
jgi:hypothetical protein